MFAATYKNIKKLASKTSKRYISGKPYMEEAPHIEGWVNTKIQYKYNLKPKTSPSDYADMLLPTKKIGVKINAVLSTIDTVEKYEYIT